MSEGIFLGQPTLAGPPGDRGTTAYELAVAEGFSGTQAEWLASLVGAAGDPGLVPFDAQGNINADRPDVGPNTIVYWYNTPSEPNNMGAFDMWVDVS